MGKQASCTRGAFSGRPKRATKIPKKFSPTLGTAQSLDPGENDDPVWRTKKSRPTIPETSGSPTQQPRQDHGHAGPFLLSTQASQLDGGKARHAPRQDSAFPLPDTPVLMRPSGSATQKGPLSGNALLNGPPAPPQPSTEGANGLQTSAQAVGGLPKQGLFNASQDLPDQQLACKRPLQHMTEQQLEATLSRMRSEIALQEGKEDRRARVDAADQLLRPPPHDPAAARAAAAQREAEHDKVWRREWQRETEMLEAELNRRARVEAGKQSLRPPRSVAAAGSSQDHSDNAATPGDAERETGSPPPWDPPSAADNWLRKQQHPRAGGSQPRSGHQEMAGREHAALEEQDAGSSEEEDEEEEEKDSDDESDDEERAAALEADQNMQHYGDGDEEEAGSPTPRRKGRGTAAQHARAAFLSQERELETLDTYGLLRCLIKNNASYHAEYQANWEDVMAELKKADRTKPEAGRDDGAHDKSLSSMVAKHTRNISFWPSEDDFEQMAATRLGCKTPAEAYSKTGMIDETMRLAKQARDIARKVYRASAVAACKAAFCKYFPQIFKAKGKGIRKAVAKKYQDKRYRTGVGREHDDYGKLCYRHALLEVFPTDNPGSDGGKITHLTASQLALMELMADRLVQGIMHLPTNNAKLIKVRGTYKGLLGEVVARSSRFVRVRMPCAQRSPRGSPASSGDTHTR